MIAAPASDFTELVLHCLAHLRSPGPEDVFDAGYVEWVGHHAPTAHLAALDVGLGRLQRHWSTGKVPVVVQAWPELFPTIAAFREVGPGPLKSLAPSQVAGASVLGWLQRADETIVESVHATLLELMPTFEGWHRDVVRPQLSAAMQSTAPWLEQAVQLMPSLAQRTIEQTSALGRHGRGLPSRILIGAALPFNGLEPQVPAILALHEESVHRAGSGDYHEVEWRALVGLTHRMQGAEPSLRAAHAQWLSSLNLVSVLDAAVARDELDAAGRQQLLAEPLARAQRLLTLGG
ncbi:MAG: hypothetical protein AAF799_06535 [Myxococcota bacterium]